MREGMLNKLRKRTGCDIVMEGCEDEGADRPTAPMDPERVTLWLPADDTDEAAVERLVARVSRTPPPSRAAVLVPDRSEASAAGAGLHRLMTFKNKEDLFRFEVAASGYDHTTVLRKGPRTTCQYVVLGSWVPDQS